MAKRGEIVDAAVRVLVRSGVAACTARAVADEARCSKGAVHYYFSEMDEIVDLAMRKAVQMWVGLITSSVEQPASRTRATAAVRFWGAMDACQQPFASGDRTMLPLWFEYWTVRTRAGRSETLREVQRLLVDLVARLLRDAGADREQDRAASLAAYLFGVSMQQNVEPLGRSAVDRVLALLSGIERPSGRSARRRG